MGDGYLPIVVAKLDEQIMKKPYKITYRVEESTRWWKRHKVHIKAEGTYEEIRSFNELWDMAMNFSP